MNASKESRSWFFYQTKPIKYRENSHILTYVSLITVEIERNFCKMEYIPW